MGVLIVAVGAGLLLLILLVLLIAAVIMRRSWGNFPSETPTLPPATLPPTLSPPAIQTADPDVLALIARGNKIQAIKLIRDRHNLGLKQAKDYVDALSVAASSYAVDLAQSTTSSTDELSSLSPLSPGHPTPDQIEIAARSYLAQGSKIEAIKRVRELTGLGLKEAKEYVDALERR